MLPSALRKAGSTAATLRAARLLSLAWVFWMLLPSPSVGQSMVDGSADPDSVLARALRALSGEPLTLRGAFDRAFSNSPRLAEAENALLAAEGTRRSERGSFDPEIFAEVEVQDTETPTSSSFAGAPVLEERAVTSRFGARTLLPFGTSITATVDATKNETNSVYQSLDPEYLAFGRLELRQPLLRGFGPGTRGDLSAAERREEAARRQLEQAERDLRAETEDLYWQLFAAERDFVVQELIVDQANALLEQARVRATAGIVGPDEVASARVFVAQQRLALLDQEEALAAASDRLVEVIGPPDGPGDHYHVADAPDFANGTGMGNLEFQAPDLLERASEQNGDLAAARLELAALVEGERSGRWNALPELDLVGSVGGNGLSGTGILGGEPDLGGRSGTAGSTEGTAIDDGLGDALSQALSRDYPTWTVGIELSLPIGLRSGRGERDRARAESARQRARITELERAVERDVRDAARRYQNGTVRLELAREGVAAAREQVRIGLIEFDSGRTTAFELVRLTADLAGSQQELSRAFVRTAGARTDLYRLVGDFGENRSEPVGGNR